MAAHPSTAELSIRSRREWHGLPCHRGAYWIVTITELRPRLTASGHLDDRLVDRFLAQCADEHWWTQTIAFTAVHARAPGKR